VESLIRGLPPPDSRSLCPLSSTEFGEPPHKKNPRVTPRKKSFVRHWSKINLKIKELNWLIGRKSHLSLENKLIIHKSIIKPIWSYGIELWGCPSKSHIVIMKRTQSKILRAITNLPWYVTNHTLHSDHKFPYVRDVIHERIGKHHTKLEAHPNPLLEPLLQPAYNSRQNRCCDISDC
jgi:hypothetical protein